LEEALGEIAIDKEKPSETAFYLKEDAGRYIGNTRKSCERNIKVK